jgi:hypothetical protein
MFRNLIAFILWSQGSVAFGAMSISTLKDDSGDLMWVERRRVSYK